MAGLLAASEGFSFGEAYPIGLLLAGIAVMAAVGALSHQHAHAFSASVIYLLMGLGAALIITGLDIAWLRPADDHTFLEHVSELAVIVALFGTGLKLERPLTWASWAGVARLLLIAMPLTIAAVALLGWAAMGLSAGAAIILGAAVAPTDPVLAGDIGVGPPGDEEEREPNFSITGEAGLNDGLALPFLLLGAFVAAEDGTGWVAEWLLADVVWAVLAGVAVGAAVGYGLRRGLRRWRRLPPLRARARVQRARARRGRHGREVRRAGGRAADRDARDRGRAEGAGAERLAARRRRRP